VSEPPFAPTEESSPSRWTGFGPALARFAFMCASLALVVGVVAAVIALATDHRVPPTIAVAYYIVGSLLFLIGMSPGGGFSLFRGTMTRRRPTGARKEPIFLLGLVLIGLGIVADIYSF
jgi:hypothetical protein